MKSLLLFITILLTQHGIAQSDTVITYLAKAGGETTRENAYTEIKFVKTNNAWHGREYYIKNGVLKSEGDYADSNVKTPLGIFNNYTETGKLDFIASYTNGSADEITYYHKNGSKKSWVTFENKQVKSQKGWDAAGKEIKDFIAVRYASLKSGPDGWAKYVKKNLDKHFKPDPSTVPGTYTLEVSFTVNVMGYTSKPKIISNSGSCKSCETEALRIISESPEWIPAISQNQPVDAVLVQPFMFNVLEGKKKNR
jgi:hypothetical protein